MGSVGRTVLFIGAALALSSAAHAQDREVARSAYFDAVAEFFRLPASEVTILGDWEIAPEEIPAVLFVARHAGVSPEALVALRRSGHSWASLSRRYSIGAADFHVPVRDEAPVGGFGRIYELFRTTPVGEWRVIQLEDAEVVGLVNVRFISESLGLPAEDVIRRTGSSSYVELFWQLKR